jgi:hypothetical protein
MARKRSLRREFIIKDLVVSLPLKHGGGGGSVFMPTDDGPELPWWISPVAGVLVKGRLVEGVRATIKDALDSGADLTGIAAAFEGDPDGSPAIRHAIHEIGAAVVASAAFTGMGGKVGMPDPNCGGTSYETIPPTLTPIIVTGMEVHQITELPRLRKQLAEAVEALDRVAADLEPRADEIGQVIKALDHARAGLRG